MKPVAIIIRYAIAMLAGMLAIWYLTFYTSLPIPEYIPKTPIKSYGLLLGALIITLLILALKKLNPTDPTLTIAQLTFYGAAMAFITQVFFQFVLMFTNEVDRLYYYITGVVFNTLFDAAIAFLIAFQLKTKRTRTLICFIIGFVLLIDAVQYVIKGKLP
jgi:ABC-type cobalamin transport system permease subunit